MPQKSRTLKFATATGKPRKKSRRPCKAFWQKPGFFSLPWSKSRALDGKALRMGNTEVAPAHPHGAERFLPGAQLPALFHRGGGDEGWATGIFLGGACRRKSLGTMETKPGTVCRFSACLWEGEVCRFFWTCQAADKDLQ